MLHNIGFDMASWNMERNIEKDFYLGSWNASSAKCNHEIYLIKMI
jgi:hypothetical protein